MRTLKRVLGAVMLGGASLLFVLFTGSINSVQQMGGPMSMGPSSTEWCVIVLFVDLILVLIGFVGSKLLGLPLKIGGGLSVLIGVLVLALGIHNRMNSPQIDSVSSGLQMPVPSALNIVVYLLAALCAISGLFMIFRAAAKQRSLKS